MDRLDFLTEEQMISFLHCTKTQISCIKEPHVFLSQLRDHDLVPEDLYQKVMKMKSKKTTQKGVYEILDRLENEQGERVKRFWKCVFQEHILQKYPDLRTIQNRLLECSPGMDEMLPNVEKPNRSKDAEREEKNPEKKKGATKRKKSNKETDEEEPGPSSGSSKKKVSSPLLKREELLVTCGDKEGILYPDKLARGEDCILSEGQWFSPPGFERFSGKGTHKNWKLSICYQKTSLQKLLKDGHLHCPHTYRGRKKESYSLTVETPSAGRSVSFYFGIPQSSTKSSSESDDSSEDPEDFFSFLNEPNKKLVKEEESDPEDLSEFQESTLLVISGSCSGVLYKKRFSGSRSKSIRTEERWFTPEEFVRQELTLTDRHWDKDILCHGKTLNYLVKKGILSVHPLLCKCPLCCPKKRKNNDDECHICNTEGDLVCCDGCPRAFHHHCHLPTLQDTQRGKWMCTFCVFKSNQMAWMPMLKKDAMNSFVSGNMRCEYLLLYLYKADAMRVFTDDPTVRVAGYCNVISKPMWLDKVKAKLLQKQYTTVNQFVRDINLIFKNWQTFNKDNALNRRMGAKIKEMFEKEFAFVFKIQ